MNDRREKQMKSSPPPLLLFVLLLRTMMVGGEDEEEPKVVHSRQKRLLWITSDGRLALPPGTTMVIAPSLSLPFVRYPPDGFFSNMTISLPFTIDFNKLGLTDNENPYGTYPPSLARSFGLKAGNLLLDYVGDYLMHFRHKRRKRDGVDTTEAPKMPENHRDAFHGGERAILYVLIEQFLDNFGMDGKACLLRAICEVHSYPLTNYGLIGEFMKLFFSASKSPYAKILTEYVEAEMAGKGIDGSPSECWPYLKDCPKSLFQSNRHNMYVATPYTKTPNKQTDNNHSYDETHENDVTYDPSIQNM